MAWDLTLLTRALEIVYVSGHCLEVGLSSDKAGRLELPQQSIEEGMGQAEEIEILD